jgi:HK97 gp10 family phage protein
VSRKKRNNQIGSAGGSLGPALSDDGAVGQGFGRKGYKKFKRKKDTALTVVQVAKYVEFGTSKQTAQPFMQNAFEGMKDELLNVFIEEMKEQLGLD